jgi:regulatory protein YycI of two-component signal transduction system YycFG
MDFGKAKSILIVAFIIVNLLLGRTLFIRQNQNVVANGLDKHVLEVIQTLFEKQNIVLKTTLPVSTPQMSFLELSYFEMDFEEVAKGFFGSLEGVVTDIRTDEVSSGVFSRGEEQLIVNTNGTIVYFNYSQRGTIYPELTEELAIKIATDFLKDKKALPRDAVLFRSIYYPEIGSYGIEFSQEYNGFHIGNSTIEIEVTTSGVRSYLQYWVQPKGNVGERKNVIPATEVLLRLADRLKTQEFSGPIIVKDIRLGHYSKHYDAATFVAVPAWRIWIDGMQDFYINAYTGDFEQ